MGEEIERSDEGDDDRTRPAVTLAGRIDRLTQSLLRTGKVTLVVGQTGSATFEVRRISKGSGDNVQIEGTRTFPPLVDTITFRCVG